MKLVVSGFDNSISFGSGKIGELVIERQTLFSRICRSLLSGAGEGALEPYALWDDDGLVVNPKNIFLPIVNPFDLPWNHKSLVGGLCEQMERAYLEDEEYRLLFDGLGDRVGALLFELSCQMRGTYGSGLKWNLDAIMKSVGFGVSPDPQASLLDNLILFVEYAADARLEKSLLFVNMRSFLSDSDLAQLHESLVFHGVSALMLEQGLAPDCACSVSKLIVDQDLVEHCSAEMSECPSSTQGRFCSIGFGAVTF